MNKKNKYRKSKFNFGQNDKMSAEANLLMSTEGSEIGCEAIQKREHKLSFIRLWIPMRNIFVFKI